MWGNVPSEAIRMIKGNKSRLVSTGDERTGEFSDERDGEQSGGRRKRGERRSKKAKWNSVTGSVSMRVAFVVEIGEESEMEWNKDMSTSMHTIKKGER